MGREPAFIPDDQDVCDDCLAEMYNLSSGTSSCCCGSYQEPNDDFSSGSVLRVLRAALRGNARPLRFYPQHSSRFFNKKGEEIFPRDLIDQHKKVHKTIQYGLVFDSQDPWPREPIETFGSARMNPGSAYSKARLRAQELNGKESP